MTDPFVGTLTFARIYSGRVESGSYVQNTVKDKRERVGRMLLMHANSREDIKEARAGDIVAMVGLKETTTGDTLCDPAKPVDPGADGVPGAGDRGRGRAEDQGRPGEDVVALNKLAQEDPSFRVGVDEESGQTVIKGMGELHLEIIVDRMKREFKVDANVGAPQVAYRETIAQAGRDRLHSQEADRRLRPVRPDQDGVRAGRAGLGLHVREQDRRRLGAEGVHSGRAEGPRAVDVERRHRGLPDDRCRRCPWSTAPITTSTAR